MSFASEVYKLTRRMPRGKVSTYKELARVLQSSPRAVGQALKRNPYAPHVPCHRVISASGKLGGFRGSVQGKDVQDKIELLKTEGVRVFERRISKEFIFSF